MKILAAMAVAFAASLTTAHAADGKIEVVAAENFYGSVAQEIGGDRVSVTRILNNPDQDPHLFEVSPAIIRHIAAARIVIYNGADYDPWIEKLLKVTARPGRVAIVAADLMNKKGRRQSAPLVRSRYHARGRERARRRAQPPPIRPTRTIMPRG